MILFPKSHNNENYNLKKTKTSSYLHFKNTNYEKISIKQPLPVQYYIMESNTNGSFSINSVRCNLKKAEVHYFKVKPTQAYETEKLQEHTRVQDLILTYGNKKSKTMVNKPSTTPISAAKISFAYAEQILPKYNDTLIVENIYQLNEMFPDIEMALLHKINFTSTDMHENLQVFFNPDYKAQLFLVDCIYKTLEKRKINIFYLKKQLIRGNKIYIDFLEDLMYNEAVTDINRDRLIILCYVLLLMVNKYKFEFEKFPKFGYDENTVKRFLKTIGCNINKQSRTVILKKAPDGYSKQNRGKPKG